MVLCLDFLGPPELPQPLAQPPAPSSPSPLPPSVQLPRSSSSPHIWVSKPQNVSALPKLQMIHVCNLDLSGVFFFCLHSLTSAFRNAPLHVLALRVKLQTVAPKSPTQYAASRLDAFPNQ